MTQPVALGIRLQESAPALPRMPASPAVPARRSLGTTSERVDRRSAHARFRQAKRQRRVLCT
jgi:hypothetical protein